MVSKKFRLFIWAVMATIFLVIFAGSVVRVTQSGMGCPDWPTCFGSITPPTHDWQVHFQPNHEYKKGQFIIENDSLKYALEKFTSSTSYNPKNWKQYEKHNNAKFSVTHTWIEFTNRLLGALLGLFVLVQCGWCLLYFKKNKAIVAWASGLVLLTIFQAWLGKTVVDSDLAVLKITLHLLGALAMVFVEIGLLFVANGKPTFPVKKPTKWLIVLLGILVTIQMIVGTQVRGQIDMVSEKMNYLDRSGWIAQLNFYFYFHRSFSLLVATLAAFLFFKVKETGAVKKLLSYVLACVVFEILLGIIFVYANFPAMAQPFHLLISCILIALIFGLLLQIKIDLKNA